MGCGNEAYMELNPEFNGRRAAAAAAAVVDGGGELPTWSEPLCERTI